MGLNIKNPEVERLVKEVAEATGVSQTEAVRQALVEKRDRLGLPSPQARADALMAKIRKNLGGRTFPPVTKAEYDALNDD